MRPSITTGIHNNRGMATSATIVYKRIATLIVEKHDKLYSKTLCWLRCRLSFSLLQSSVMCLQGSRSVIHHPAHLPLATIELACTKGKVPLAILAHCMQRLVTCTNFQPPVSLATACMVLCDVVVVMYPYVAIL